MKGVINMSKPYRRGFGRGGPGYNLDPNARRKVAEESNASWAALPPADQLRLLDARLGVGVGAQKQRAKIAKQMNTKENS
jgi:hypothetical protein